MKDFKKLDLQNLDEIIKRCEEQMISPFRKKKEPEMEDEGEGEEEVSEEPQEKPDLEGMDLEQLMEMYEKLKDEEGE
jgi:hypothetical protein